MKIRDLYIKMVDLCSEDAESLEALVNHLKLIKEASGVKTRNNKPYDIFELALENEEFVAISSLNNLGKALGRAGNKEASSICQEIIHQL